MRRSNKATPIKSCTQIAAPPLIGEAHLMMTSLPSVYDLKKFVCAWDVAARKYWWYSPLKKGSVNPIYGGQSGNAKAEVGQGWWLTPPKYFDLTSTKWSSSSWVATVVPAFNHTSCCCQFMSGDTALKKFWLTEYCRAVVVGLDKTPEETCKPYTTIPCPADNATASQEPWAMPPYSESYSACLDPLGTTLPKHGYEYDYWKKTQYDINIKQYDVNIPFLIFAVGAVPLLLWLYKTWGHLKDYLQRPVDKAVYYLPLAKGNEGNDNLIGG